MRVAGNGGYRDVMEVVTLWCGWAVGAVRARGARGYVLVTCKARCLALEVDTEGQ